MALSDHMNLSESSRFKFTLFNKEDIPVQEVQLGKCCFMYAFHPQKFDTLN